MCLALNLLLIPCPRGGEVVAVHCVTVDSQTDGYAPLTEEQHDELLAALAKSMGLLF